MKAYLTDDKDISIVGVDQNSQNTAVWMGYGDNTINTPLYLIRFDAYDPMGSGSPQCFLSIDNSAVEIANLVPRAVRIDENGGFHFIGTV